MLLSKLESVQGGMFFLIDLKQRPLKHSVLTTNVWTNTWGRSKENGNTPPKPSPHGGIAQFGIQRHRTLRMGGGLTQQPWILPHSLWQLKENLILVKFNFAYAVINLKKKKTVKGTERHFLCSRGMQTSSKQGTALLWLKYSYHDPPASRRLSPLQARLNFISESYSSQSRFVSSLVALTGKNMPSQKLFCWWKKGFSEISSWDGGFCESHLRCYQVIKRNHLWTAWRGF